MSQTTSRLTGRSAIVTGATQGLGADIARVLEEDIQRISASINRANLINAGVTLERGQCDASSMNGNWSGRRGALDPDDI